MKWIAVLITHAEVAFILAVGIHRDSDALIALGWFLLGLLVGLWVEAIWGDRAKSAGRS